MTRRSKSLRRLTSLAAVWLLCGTMLLSSGMSCGGSSNENDETGDGDSGGEGPLVGGSAGTGRGGQGGASGTGGPGGESGAGSGGTAGVGGEPPDDCGEVGSLRCAGNTRERCEANGSWEPLPTSEQCEGTTPVCTGGVCAALRLVEGTIDAPGLYPEPASGASYVLVRQSLLGLPKACGASHCVTGSIRP